MTQDEFLKQTEEAVRRMKEMNLRSNNHNSYNGKMPPTPSFVKVNHTQQNTPLAVKEEKPPKMDLKKNNSFLSEIPFLENILKDSDTVLIIGLLLILLSENTDKILLFALIYILM